MQTQNTAQKKSDQSTGRVSNNIKNIPASQKTVSKKPTVRTTEYKKMIEICLTDPDSITREEFLAFQSAIGYGQAVRLVEEGKRRKRAGKGEQQEGSTTTPKMEMTKKSLTKTIIDTAKPKEDVIKPVDQPTKTMQNKVAPQVIKKAVQVAPKVAQATKAAVQTAPKATQAVPKAAPKSAIQTAAKVATQAVPKTTVQTADKVEPQAVPKAAQASPEVELQAAVKEAPQEKTQKAGGKLSAAEQKAKSAVSIKGTTAVTKQALPMNAADKAVKKSDKKNRAASANTAGGMSLGAAPAAAQGPSAQQIKESIAPKRKVKPAVKITGEDPGKILNQLGSADVTEVVNTYSQATAASKGAFDKEREKTQKLIPEIPTPTGLEPVKKQGNTNNKLSPLKHKMITAFKAAKAGGKAQEGNLQDFNVSEKEDLDADDVMKEARACTENAPEIGMTGEADPSQIEGFEAEASGNVQDSKQAEISQISKEFGENNIAPKVDNTLLKATNSIRAAVPLSLDIKKMSPVKPEVAERVDPSLGTTLQGYMDGEKGKYQKGKAEYDVGVTAEKAKADEQIESQKAEASEKQLAEQEKAKSEVGGYRDQWQNEIDDATSEYDNEANAEVDGKKKEVGNIKEEKDGEVKSTLSTAEKDAEKECDTAKADADEKEREGEKKKKGFNPLEWIGDGLKAIGEGIKKAVNGIFNALRSAVKTIFEKAKQAALAVIEAGRKLIVNCIKGLGEILKKLVTKLLEKFPGIAKKICALIDAAVNKAVEVVNKIADGLKKAVTAVLDFMAKGFDNLFAGLQKLYNGIMDGLKKFLSMDFMELLKIALEAAQIAAEIALAFATGGGSVLVQIVKWLATTLPGLINKAKTIMSFVNTIKSIKFDDIKKLLNPSGIADFLVKGLFGELKALPGAGKEEKEAKEPAAGGAEKGLMKVLGILTKVFNAIKGVYVKVTGAINKVLPIINITNKKWFNPFSMIYAGVAKVIEVVPNPAEALGEGVGKLKEGAGSFFGGMKTKITEVAGSIKEKVAILGKPAELIKVIANKGVDMVLNFIITNPPSALLKAVFKLIEAVAGKSLVELIRQTIPFADTLLNKIAGSAPVQAIAQPLQGPIEKVSGAIDEVTEGATGIVGDAEEKTMSAFGSGDKLISGLSGGGSKGKGGGKKGSGGGGDFLGTLKSGIHTRLVAFGEINLLKKGKDLAKAGIGKLKEMLTPKVKFKLGTEDHELWVERGKNKNVVMMASEPNPAAQVLDKKILEQVKLSIYEAEHTSADKITKKQAEKITNGIKAADTGVSKAAPMTWNEFQAANAGKFDKAEMSVAWEKYKKEHYPNEGKHYLERPYIRQVTIDGVDKKTKFNSKRQPWDIVEKEWIEGTPDLGHESGNEFWYERDQAEAKGWTQQQFNDYMNNPKFYRWEKPSSNRSHKHEDRHEE